MYSSWPEEAKVKGTNCRLTYLDGNPASFSTLKKLSKRKIDCVVLAGLEDLSPKIADAQVTTLTSANAWLWMTLLVSS